jgi:hypothetical protein
MAEITPQREGFAAYRIKNWINFARRLLPPPAHDSGARLKTGATQSSNRCATQSAQSWVFRPQS